MKILNQIASMALMLTLAASCAVHDPFDDNGELGQVLPTVDWEQNSTVVKAGSYATFTAKYYTSSDRSIDHSEVWALVKREQKAAATSKLTSSLAYTKTYALTDTVRSAQSVAKFPHDRAVWDGYEFVLTDSFATSRTLAPVSWIAPEAWDQEKFASLYPSTFADEFTAHMVEALTKDSTYYNDMRTVYINYDFKKELFEQLNAKYNVSFPTDTTASDKSKNWFTTVTNGTDEVNEVDHYYYILVDEAGQKSYHEIANESDAPSGVSVFPVYKSSPWLFSRYSDDTGGKITTIRNEWMPYFKDLITTIPFEGWIYDAAEKNYKVNFLRTYYLCPTFRVYDTEGKMGETTDNKEITLN